MPSPFATVRNIMPQSFATMLFMFSVSLYTPLLSPHLKTLGYSEIHISWMFAASPFITIIATPFFGFFSDAIGRKKIIALGIFLQLVAAILFTLASTAALIVIAVLLDAMATYSTEIILLAALEDRIANNRGKLFGIYLAIGGSGRYAGFLIGAFLADSFFIRFPFITSATILAILLFALRYLEITDNAETENISFRSFILHSSRIIKTNWQFLSSSPFTGVVIQGISFNARISMMSIFLPLFILENLHGTYKHIGLVFFASQITVLAQIYFGGLTDRFGGARMTLGGCYLCAATTLLIPFSSTIPQLMLIMFINSIGLFIWNTSAWILIAESGKKVMGAGSVMSTYVSISRVGSLVGFMVSGYIVVEWGIKTLFIANAILLIICTILSRRYILDKTQ